MNATGRAPYRLVAILAALALLAASGGCASSGDQSAENMRADTILKQSADASKQQAWQRVDGGIGP